MSRVNKTAIIIVLLAIVALVALRAVQVISAKKDEPKRQGGAQAPLVEVAPVTEGLMEEKIFRTGDIAPYAQVAIYSKTQGWVDKINVREGDRVQVGQVLVTLDAREAEAAVAQSKANLEAATARLKQVKATSEEAVQSQIQHTKATLELAESDLQRARDLYGKNFIARQQMDEAQTKYNVAKAAYDLAQNSLRQKTWENDIAVADAQVRQARANLDLTQAQLANLIILSPMNGSVTKRHVDPGTMVKDTTPILTLMDLNEVKIVVNVIEKEFIQLQKGQPVKVTVTAFPSRSFQGTISVIPPALEIQSRTAEIQITIPNPGYVLSPGMFGRVEILLRSKSKVILAPIQGVQTQGNMDYVFVFQDDKAFRRAIQKGLTRDTQVEVTQGLSLGERVIIASPAALKDGLPVRLAVKTEKKEPGQGKKP